MKTRRTIKGTSVGGLVEEAYTPSNPPPYPVTSVAGRTGAVTLSKSDVGLSNVDNTSDTAKPVSTAQATAIAEAKQAGTNAQNAIDTHAGNTSNPHSVTAAQIGAYVKPVSGIPESDLSAEVQAKLNSGGGGGATTANLLKSSVTANRQAGVTEGDMVNLGYALGLEEGKMYTVKYKFNGADIVATAKYEAPMEGTLTGATLALCQSISAEGETMKAPMLLGVQDYNASVEDYQNAAINYGFLNIVDKHQITEDESYTADENSCSVYPRALQTENAQNAVSVEITAIEPFTEVAEVVADKVKNSLKINVNGTAYSYDGSVETEINIETGGGGGGEVPAKNLLQSPVSANRQANVTEGDMVNLGYALGLEEGKQYTVKYKFNNADVVATAKYEAPTGLPMEGGELCLCQSMSYEGQAMTFPMLLGVSPYAASFEDCQNAMQNYGMLFIVDKHQITGDTTYSDDENNSSVYPRALQRSQAGNAVSVEISAIEPFTEVAEVVADRVKNALTIGNVVFDGSAAKSVDLSEYAKTTGTYSGITVGNADKLGNKAASEYVLASDIPDVSNFAEKTGTYSDMTVGNAKKLNGKAASEYALAADLTAHETNISNPHSVSKEQVGLENVANERQYSLQNPPPYPVTSVAGQTGAVTLTKNDVGLDNVDNTSDEDKPVSTAQATAIADAKKAGTDAQSNVDKIINGTTAVGNAEKLGNKAASEYALKSDIKPRVYSTKKSVYPYKWETKTWSGLTALYGNNIWTDGDNIYNSNRANHYVLNRETSTWEPKTWNGLTSFNGGYIWTDGNDIYYSNGTEQYVLNRRTSTWEKKIWNGGLTSFNGDYIWTDGNDIYYSYGSNQYVLNKEISTWESKTWNGLTSFNGFNTWTDGNDIYYSPGGSNQYVLNKETSTWEPKTWNGLTSFYGNRTWTDGENIYYSQVNDQYVLNRETSTWGTKSWGGMTGAGGNGANIWTDGENIYYSDGTDQYKLTKAIPTLKTTLRR